MKRGWRLDGTKYRTYEIYDELPELKCPPGIYTIGRDLYGWSLNPTDLVTDKLLELTEPYSAKIIAEFSHFWKLKESFTKRGFLHKRGMLLYGLPGCGKTALISILARKVVSEIGGIVIVNVRDPRAVGAMLKDVRKVESSGEQQPIVVVFEDLDSIISTEGDDEEPTMLSLLDGEAQIDGVIYLATTNYIEKLPPRIVNRPSRFDTVMEIKMPAKETRRAYFMAKEPGLTDAELKLWVDETDGLGIAHLKEVIIGVKCFGYRVEDVVARLRKLPRVENET